MSNNQVFVGLVMILAVFFVSQSIIAALNTDKIIEVCKEAR